VTAPATVSVDATLGCTARVALQANVVSPLGLATTSQYFVDDVLIANATAVSANLGVGTHNALVVASDNLGEFSRLTQTITVHDKTPPVFANAPAAVLAKTCSSAAAPIAVTVPAAGSQCSGLSASVTGQVIQYNGVSSSIPVVNGTVIVPPGSGVIRYTAQDANGTVTVDQPLVVQGPALLYGRTGITLSADGAIVNGTVLAGPGGLLSLGNDSSAGDLLSLSPVRLFDRAVTGIIQTTAGVTQGNGDHILRILDSAPALLAFPQLSRSFTDGAAVNVAPDATQTIAPGRYGAVTVFSRGRLTLGAGAYDFTALDLEPQAQLIVPSSNQSVQIFVRDNVTYRGTVALSTGQPAPLYLGFTGTSPVVLESPFTGTVVAPSAQLTLQTVNNASHTGEFFANHVVVAPHTTVHSIPFTCH
jgi:hypothetical protein